MDYYLQTKDGQQAGPYSLDQLRAFWTNGQIVRTTPYWSPGMAGWQPVSMLEHILRPPPAPEAVRALALPSQAPQKAIRPATVQAPKLGCRQIFNGCLIIACLGIVAVGVFTVLLGIGVLPVDRPPDIDVSKNGYEGDYADSSSNHLKITGKWVVLTTGWIHWSVDSDKGPVNYNSSFEGAIASEQVQSSPYKVTMQLPEVFEETHCMEGSLFNATTKTTESHPANGSVLEIDVHGNATYTLTDQGDTTIYHFRKE